MQAFSCSPDGFGDFKEGLVAVGPLGDRATIGRSCQQLAKRRAVPIAGAKDHWNDDGIPRCVTLHRTGHFALIAIVGCDEVGADQQKNDVGNLHVSVDRAVDVLTRADPPVVPCGNDPLALEHGQLLFQLVAQRLVGMGIGKE